MNRDWTVLSQMETRARIKAYQRYQPQVYVDVHEMGENSHLLFSRRQHTHKIQTFQRVCPNGGKNSANQLQQSSINLELNITRKKVSISGIQVMVIAGRLTMAQFRELSNKEAFADWLFDATMEHGRTLQRCSLSSFSFFFATCKMSAANRKEKLQDFYDFHTSAIQEGKTGPIREYIIRRSPQILRRQIVRWKFCYGMPLK